MNEGSVQEKPAETQQYFERLESSRGNNCELIEREIQTRIDTITRNCDRLDMLVHKEPPSRRTTSKMRVDQLKYDNIHLQFTTNNSHLEGDTSILMDHSLQHNSALQSGAGILENLRDQRSTLKGAHRRLYDIANTLGLSNTTMRLIERRAYQDKFILLGGMLVTTFLITLIIIIEDRSHKSRSQPLELVEISPKTGTSVPQDVITEIMDHGQEMLHPVLWCLGLWLGQV
uniref:Golgi SNAP receptor complex member 2 n=1 Tax=Timema monikensis TaxID=170555 RepID=A0A7R9HIT5_9NEOP|nr:unnamed protein product [Timema monikensis]